MIPLRRLLLISCVMLTMVAPGCGKKGPPLAPLRPVPVAVEQLTARRLGDTVRLELVIPDRNADGSRPADLTRVEIYGLTIDPNGRQPTEDEFLERSTVVATIDVRPPPGAEAEPPDARSAPPDTRAAPGATVTVEEQLTGALCVPVRFDPQPGTLAPAPPPLAAQDPAAGTGARGLTRTYLALAFGRRNRPSAPSARLEVTLRAALPPPSKVDLTYTETAFTLMWSALGGDPWRPVWSFLGYQRGFNVYEFASEAGTLATIRPVNEKPMTDSMLAVPLIEFGVARCFGVRTVETIGGQAVESELSAPVCVTPVDRFPPAAPAGLVAIAEAGGIRLIWNANQEQDLAGYVVLRSDAPDATLRTVTPAPIRETTYRDGDVRPGTRYVYGVVAVDTASPPNRSAPSARVDATAR